MPNLIITKIVLFGDYQCNTGTEKEIKCEKTRLCVLETFKCDGRKDCCGDDIEKFAEQNETMCDDDTDERDCPAGKLISQIDDYTT